MTTHRFGRVVAAIAAATFGTAIILAPSMASAGVTSTLAFETAGPVTVDFSQDWLITLSVSTTYEGGPTVRLGPNDGTVDVYFSGVGGVFSAGLPIQPDGLIYVSQPAKQPLLPAGDYSVTAIFNPAPGGYYNSSQTASPLAFTVTALDVAPRVEVGYDASVSKYPVITASLAGAYVDATGGAPAGTWSFVVTGPKGDAVLTRDVAQVQGDSDPLRVEVTSRLAKGEQYSVASTFTPAQEIAGGLTVPGIPAATFQTPAGTFAESMGASVPLPLWLLIVLGVLLLGLATTAVILGVRLSGRAPKDAAPAATGRAPGDPTNVEIVGLDALGLPEPATIPEMLPAGEPTTRMPTLPESTTWLLSDVEPAVDAPTINPADAPTERIGIADLLAEPATERVDTTETLAESDPADEAEGDRPSGS